MTSTMISKIRRAALLTVAAGVMAGPSGVVDAASKPPKSDSFFEPFDGVDARRWYISDGWVNGPIQSCTWARETLRSGGGMLHLRVAKSPNKLRDYKCAEIHTTASFGYGTYEARIRTADGSGLNTAMFTYSGPPITPKHDEIDFEFLGKNAATVQLNYYTGAKGGHETFVSVPGTAAAAFHNYAFVWSPGLVKWYIDGKLVRTASGTELPSTPGKFYLSLWSGSPNVDGWLGKFDTSHLPAEAQFDWAAYTAPGEHCRFAQSITCQAASAQ